MAGQISDTTTLFVDDFHNAQFYKDNWDYNQWRQIDNPSYIGRTQMQQKLPEIVNNELRLRVDTWLNGKAFSGDEAITKKKFNISKGGIAFETTAHFDLNNAKGLVGGMFPFGITTGKKKNEIDWEGLSNQYTAKINQIQTNVYADALPGQGSVKFVNVPGSMAQNHVYRIEWLKGEVRWLIDGQLVRSEKAKVPPNKDVQMHLNFWAADDKWKNAYSDTLQPAANAGQSKKYYFYVDKVAVTQLATTYGDKNDNVLTGTESHEWLRGHAGKDEIRGGLGNDTIKGNQHADTLFGEEGDDTVAGGRGNDILNGGAGNDVLKGRSGHDTFVFDTELSVAGTDRIKDFTPGVDKISLAGAAFAGLGLPGLLDEAAFHLGASAADANDRIIYDSATGSLKFDPDGTGPDAEVTFATLSIGLALTSADFIVA
jgi:beta-glucanase (GH16 family)